VRNQNFGKFFLLKFWKNYFLKVWEISSLGIFIKKFAHREWRYLGFRQNGICENLVLFAPSIQTCVLRVNGSLVRRGSKTNE